MAQLAETLREALASVVRTVSHSFVLSGRSRRTEVLNYVIASWIITTAFTEGFAATLHWPTLVIAREVPILITAIPFFALFVRRSHDHGRSGWWVLMLPPILASNVYELLRVQLHAYDPLWPDLGAWNLILLIPVLLMLGLLLAEGDVGDNDYGPDPRLESRQKNPA